MKDTLLAYASLERYASFEKLYTEFHNNKDFRNIIIGLSGMYGCFEKINKINSQDNKFIKYLASIEVIYWRDCFADKVMKGEEDSFLRQQGDIGLDAILCSVSESDFWKFGGFVKSYFDRCIDINDPAVGAAIKYAANIKLLEQFSENLDEKLVN